MKIVLDCNVIISAGLTDGTCRKVLWHVLQSHTLYISEEILIEYKEVVSRPKFKHVYKYLYSLIEIVCEMAELVTIQKSDYFLPDVDDLIYLNTALTIDAEYLITGNIKDFPEGIYKNTKVISPKEALAI